MPFILDASMSREATNRALSRIPPGEATAHISHADLSTDGGFSSDVLNVNFDLALDDWDDFSDDNFMTACEDLFHQGRGSAQTTGASFLLDLFRLNRFVIKILVKTLGLADMTISSVLMISEIVNFFLIITNFCCLVFTFIFIVVLALLLKDHEF